MIENINQYDEKKFEIQFCQTDLHQKLSKDFQILDFGKNFIAHKHATSRQDYGTTNKTIFSVNAFYYLKFLTDRNPKKIYDLGCGWNIFKKYIPNIIGIGAEDPKSGKFFGDIHDFVDENFVQGHQNYFESVFSICSMHFVPLSCLKKRVLDFYSMIAPNGCGFLSFNVARMIELETQIHEIQISYDDDLLEQYIRQELFDLEFKFDVVDIDLTVRDEIMQGNIRLVMHKQDVHDQI